MDHGPADPLDPTDPLGTADPLSDIVAMLRPHDCVAAGLDAGGDWAIRFERHAGLKCNAVLRGECRLSVEGMNGFLRLEAGDCFILPHGRPFLISARDATLGDDATTIYAPVPHGGTAVHGGGGAFFMTGARFLLSGPAADMLLRALPPVIVVRHDPGGSTRGGAIRWTLERIAIELRDPRPGGSLLIAHLSHALLVEVLRQHIATGRSEMRQVVPSESMGWMAALADPAIARAIAVMHDDPARSWTVEALASHAAMSRTTFAVRFRRVVGQTPIGYLAQWRMLCAADRLRRTTDRIASIAADLGYTSESAFAHAFKREMGHAPRRYAREQLDEAKALST